MTTNNVVELNRYRPKQFDLPPYLKTVKDVVNSEEKLTKIPGGNNEWLQKLNRYCPKEESLYRFLFLWVEAFGLTESEADTAIKQVYDLTRKELIESNNYLVGMDIAFKNGDGCYLLFNFTDPANTTTSPIGIRKFYQVHFPCKELPDALYLAKLIVKYYETSCYVVRTNQGKWRQRYVDKKGDTSKASVLLEQKHVLLEIEKYITSNKNVTTFRLLNGFSVLLDGVKVNRFTFR